MEGGIKIEINKNTESQKKSVEVEDGNFVGKKNSLKEDVGKNANELEDLNTQIENSDNPEEKNEIFKKAEKIEKIIDTIESELGELGIDGSEILTIYEGLTEESVERELRDGSNYAIVKNLALNNWSYVKKKLELLSPKIIACFVFMSLIAVMPIEADGAEMTKAEIENSQEVEKNDIDKFLKKLEVVRIFDNQEYLDMKIPAKPKGHDDEDWQIMIYEKGVNIGSFDVGVKSFFGAFGRNRNLKIDKVELAIEKDGEFKSYEVDIL